MFDAWWAENKEKYAADSLHMSQYHMASIVWEAAQVALINSRSDFREFIEDGAE